VSGRLLTADDTVRLGLMAQAERQALIADIAAELRRSGKHHRVRSSPSPNVVWTGLFARRTQKRTMP
jgi:hypothetical protein